MKYILKCLFIALPILSTSCDKIGISSSSNKFSSMDMDKVLSQDLRSMESSNDEMVFPIEIRVPENISDEIMMSDVIDSVWYVKLQDITNDLMSDFMAKIQIHDDVIYLLDGQNNQVYVFSISGEFLFSKTAEGDGPKEFSRAGSMSVDPYNNQLVIHDDRLSKMLYYTLDGEFLREQRIAYRFLDFASINDSLTAVDLNKTDNTHIDQLRNNQLALVDNTWKVLATGGEYDSDKERKLFYTGNTLSRNGGDLFYMRPFSSTVFQVENDALIPYCRIDFGKRTLPENTNFDFKWASDFADEYVGYSYMVGSVLFMKNVSYFNYDYQWGKTAHVFRSNSTGKLFHGMVNNDMSALGFFHISTSIPEENILVSYLSSEEIYAKKDVILETERGSKALRDMIENTESTDNPVLIFYKLRADY